MKVRLEIANAALCALGFMAKQDILIMKFLEPIITKI
jgi:hypothetical protein